MRKHPPDDEPVLTGIEVTGFKSVKKRRKLSIKPLTVLAGANSSGKSSMLQPLLLLKQTVDAPFDPGALRLNGPNLKYTKAEQVLSRARKGSNASVTSFSIALQMSNRARSEITFQRLKDRGFAVSNWRFGDTKNVLEVGPDPSPELIKRIVMDLLNDSWRSVYSQREAEVPWTIKQERFLFDIAIQVPHTTQSVAIGTEIFSKQLEVLRRVIHVPGLRGTPERSYPVTAVGETFEGRFDDYVASVVHEWQINKDHRLRILGEDLKNLHLTWKIEAKPLDDTQVELTVGRLPQAAVGGAHDLVNIADVGFGVSQVLPVLVALLAAEPGQLVCIEQPEIHLHPRAHVALAAILAREAGKGKLLAVETHSSHLLRGIQTVVAEGGLHPDRVALHWFHRDAGGQTEITPGTLDRGGAFGDWPVDFDDVSLDQDQRYVDAAFEAAG